MNAYYCGDCDVAGYGDECWNCGSKAHLKRIPYPAGGTTAGAAVPRNA